MKPSKTEKKSLTRQKICLIYNFAQHYRYNIFKLLDENFQIDFVFGDKMDDVKKMDYSVLKNFIKEVKNETIIGPLYFQKGVISLIKGNYSFFIVLGDIHCLSTWILLILAKIYKKKVLLWTHGWYGKEKFYIKSLKKIFLGMAYKILLYGDYAKNLMIQEGFKTSKLAVIYNSLNYNQNIELRKKLKKSSIYIEHFKNPNPNLVFIGRLTAIKRLDLLFKAIYLLKKKSKHYNLTLIGSGAKESELKSLANDLNIKGGLWFYGSCYEEEKISELIYNADLCISPGNVGLTAIHSLSYGTPVITHDNFAEQMPEFEAIVDGVTGLFFEQNNVRSLAGQIENWCSKMNKNREQVRIDCYEIIDSKYNPYVQLDVIKSIINS